QDVIKIGKATFTFLCQKETKKLQAQKENNFDSIISQNASMKEVFSLIQVVAPTDVTVFIHGETGTGKELVARAISQHSLRTDKPFLSVNCGAISKDLIESELFGHEKGAFTSAHQQRKGLFEQAHQGTLFLDEIGELSLELQPKLLRVLETGDLRRVGGHQDIHVDVRIIAATHRDLPEMVKQNRFREDLLYRLFVIPVEIPALRDRKED
ncbi:MAG: sigma-54 factor interaction domain-containing protein, partial [Planctomycetales bacterium]|nr:sigma-54 factor interaction domain-containing protein [Planctomycetales bacterium]